MGESGSSSFLVVVLFATLLVAPIVAEKTINVDLPTFEALMNMNGKAKYNEGYRCYCCENCFCDSPVAGQCECRDVFVGGCPSECNGNGECLCTRSIPPYCRCVKVAAKCPVKLCHTSQLPE